MIKVCQLCSVNNRKDSDMRSIKQLVKHITLSVVCLMSYANCMGQICQNLDSTIIGVLTLCCFQNGPLHNWIDEDLQIEEDTYPLCIKNVAQYGPIGGIYALYMNIDSTELLIAMQAPGMNRGDVGTLMVVLVDKNELDKLPLSRCTYTNLPHFQTEQGVRIGMTREELIVLKGNQFRKNKDGYMCYTSLSPYAPDDPEAIEYYEKHGLGDLFLNVHFKEGVVDWFRLEWAL